MELRERPAPPPENTHHITVELDRLVDERIAAIKNRCFFFSSSGDVMPIILYERLMRVMT